MAGKTALIGLHGSVLENEWPHGIGMALGANRKLTGRRSHLMTGLGAVRIMAVAALNESDVNPMPVRPREFRLLRGMAAVAQGSLRLYQKKIDFGSGVGTVTRCAADAVGQVLRVGKILRFQTGLMALGADRRRLGRTQGFETNDLGGIAAAVNVGLRRTMTSLAAMLIALEQRGVRRTGEVLVPHFLVTCLANFGVGVLAAGRAGERGRCRWGWGSWVLLRSQRDRQAGSHEECQDEWQERSAFALHHPCPRVCFGSQRSPEHRL